MNSLSRARSVGTAILAVLALTACGGGSDDEHQATHIDTAGRLALLERGSKAVRVYDLDSKSVAQMFTMLNAPSAIYASPGKRYALAVQRTQDLVQVIDGGIWQEDHLDHKDDYKEAPKQLDFALTGIRPTHYEAHDDVAAFFMDGLADTGQAASVHVISDASLGESAVEARLDLPVNMHGTAEPRGNYLLTTYRAPGGTDTLPVQVDLYRRSGSRLRLRQALR